MLPAVKKTPLVITLAWVGVEILIKQRKLQDNFKNYTFFNILFVFVLSHSIYIVIFYYIKRKNCHTIYTMRATAIQYDFEQLLEPEVCF